MNVELLKKIKRRILREPQKFRMDEWSCGTAHCIGGWACVLSGETFKRDEFFGDYIETEQGRPIEGVAARLLGFRSDAKRDRLFQVSYWPERFYNAYRDARSRKQRAQIAAKRIDHFIATNGKE